MAKGERAGSAIPRAASAGHIKGAAFREFILWYRARVGEDRARALVAALAPEVRCQLDVSAEAFGILASRWYQAEVIHGVCDAVIEGMAATQRAALARDAARVLMDTTLRGIYRLLFEQLASPARIVQFAPRIWRTYFDSGERRTEVVSAGRHDGIVRDWRGHHPFLCAVQVHSTSSLYQAAGCRNVATTSLECVELGAPHCRWSTTWQP